MRKNILVGTLAIAAVASLSIGGAVAWFSDTESAQGNTFAAGTIDIAVNGQNPWTDSFHMEDMKPSQVGYTNFSVQNVGDDPVNLFKNLSNFEVDTEDVVWSESKCDALNGTWTTDADGPDADDCTGELAPTEELQDYLQYDLSVKLYDVGDHLAWSQTLYDQNDTIDDIYDDEDGLGVFLGMIPAGWRMDVTESYHLDDETPNSLQGEAISFDIDLTGEQLHGEIVLRQKTADGQWLLEGGEATFSYGVRDDALNYTLDVNAPALPDGVYTLVTWEDNPAHNWTWGSFSDTTVIANVTLAGGIASDVTGSLDLHNDLIDSKIWLIPGNLGAPGAIGVPLFWDSANTLFETGLIDYYDSSTPQ
ncbi:MAG: TasA family protein [Candidatus Pacebacteria bacterium]|nr:TasA family protein [Candidatus Paceibacterota bacterium]